LHLRHTTTIVDLRAKHVEHLVRYVIVSLYKLLQLASANDQIFIGEGVWDVPADRTELSPILDDGVEEAESKEDFLIDLWLRAFLELFGR